MDEIKLGVNFSHIIYLIKLNMDTISLLERSSFGYCNTKT